MSDRAGQVWMLPIVGRTWTGALSVPCLVLWSEVVMLMPKMSDQKRVPYHRHELLNLLTGERDCWYEHSPLADERGCRRLLP